MIRDALRDVFCYVPSYGGLRVGSWLMASMVPALVRAPVTRAKRKTRSDKGTKRPRKGPTRTPDSGVVLF